MRKEYTDTLFKSMYFNGDIIKGFCCYLIIRLQFLASVSDIGVKEQ